MDASELAKKMLEWETLKRQLQEVEEAIKDTVLEIGKTQTVGNVRASYSGGRRSYHYQATLEMLGLADDERLAPFRSITTDWIAACKALVLTEIPFDQGPPSVTVKLI